MLILSLSITSFAMGKTVMCDFCGEKIEEQYTVVNKKAFHKNHFKCAHCNRQITDGYLMKNEKYYDKKCYTQLFSLKCAICSQPISGEYLIDGFGVKYHEYHDAKLNRCDICNRMISKKTTSGGVKYSDGRKVCNICNHKKLTSNRQYTLSFNKVISHLIRQGLTFNKKTISLKVVSLTELQRLSKSRHSKNIRGFTSTSIEERLGGKRFKHTVYVLSGTPSKFAEATMAHELMHVWISVNIPHKLTEQLEEGSCNYISYIYLKSDHSADAKDIIRQLKSNPDKIYGDGYRKVYARFKGQDLNGFLDYLRKNNR